MNIAQIFLTVSLQLNLPPGLLSSVCYVESRHNPAAIHHDDGGSDSLGLCQIKLSTARWLGFKGTEQDLMNPQINAHYAGAYLRYQLNRYGSVKKAVTAYNIGHAVLTTTKYQIKVYKEWENDLSMPTENGKKRCGCSQGHVNNKFTIR